MVHRRTCGSTCARNSSARECCQAAAQIQCPQRVECRLALGCCRLARNEQITGRRIVTISQQTQSGLPKPTIRMQQIPINQFGPSTTPPNRSPARADSRRRAGDRRVPNPGSSAPRDCDSDSAAPNTSPPRTRAPSGPNWISTGVNQFARIAFARPDNHAQIARLSRGTVGTNFADDHFVLDGIHAEQSDRDIASAAYRLRRCRNVCVNRTTGWCRMGW